MYDDIIARDEFVAVATLVFGVVAARLLSIAIGGLLGFLDQRASRLATTDKSMISPRLIRMSRAIVFWLVVMLAILYSLQILGVGDLSATIATAFVFIPQLLIAFSIIVAGHIVGLLASHVAASRSDLLTTSSLAPRLIYGTIVVVAVVMGLQHIHVDISFVTQLLLIAFAVVGSGLMLAFALGARQHVANLLARRELSRLRVSDRIRVDGVEGEIVSVHATCVDIATEEGLVSVPAARFAATSVLNLTEARRDE